MRRTLFVLLLATGALAQNNESTLRQPGSEALSREQARSKQELCSKAEKGVQVMPKLGACLNRQFKITEQNYLAYIRSIGALLRLSLPGQFCPWNSQEASSLTQPKMRGSSIAMQAAQNRWCRLRNGCGKPIRAVAYADCRVKLTSKHMNELADLYADLWH